MIRQAGAQVIDQADRLNGEAFLDRLAVQLPRLRAHHEPAPYWPARHGRDRAGAALNGLASHKLT